MTHQQDQNQNEPKLLTILQKSGIIVVLGALCFLVGPYLNFWSNQVSDQFWKGLLWLLYFGIGLQIVFFNSLNIKYHFLTIREYETVKKIVLQRYKEIKNNER